MASQRSFPWREVNDFVADLGVARSLDELARLAVERIGGLVPHDRGAATFRYQNGRVPPCVHISSGSEAMGRDFNNHWRHRFPLPLDYVERNRLIDFRLWEETEYVQDFLRPNRVRWATSTQGTYQIAVYRTASSPAFTGRDVRVLEVLDRHVVNIFRRLEALERIPRDRVTEVELGPGARVLTRREEQVARHLALRLSAREIASMLLVSPRTVERHITNIYDKLGVHCRSDMLRRLYGHDLE